MAKQGGMRQTIVVAWTDNDGLRLTGRLVKPDGVNTRAEFETCPMAHAVVWKRGGAEDITKAQRFADTLTDKLAVRVFTYPSTERNPLGKAKAALRCLAHLGCCDCVPDEAR